MPELPGVSNSMANDITALPTYNARSQLGLARSFQITSLFPRHDARSTMSRSPCRRMPVTRFSSGATLASSEELRASAPPRRWRGSASPHRANTVVSKLEPWRTSPARNRDGARHQPRMLLLDEPMAGMGPEESARMVKMLRELKGDTDHPCLIEHDMEAVFALADRITVLVYGRVIATGKPDAIRANAEVREAYLGEQEAR